jgi:Fur family ferric uptake transcriptional regulator
MRLGWGRWRHGRGKHEELRAQLDDLLHATGAEPDADEVEVISCFLRAEGHVSAEELAARAGRRRHDADVACARAVLRRLEKLGVAKRVMVAGGEVWEHLHVGEHHDHLICVRCGKVAEFVDQGIEARQVEQARLAGFRPLTHRLQIYGLCPECVGRHGETVPLSELSVGERGEIESLAGGRGSRRRLEEMGLLPGTVIEVLASLGLKLVLVRGARLALSHGLARKVMVRRGGQ